MNVEMREKMICCMLAAILFFWGISAGSTAMNSSFSRLANLTGTTNETLCSVKYITEETSVCTPAMLSKSIQMIRGNSARTMIRWQDRTVLLFLAGVFLQYLFYYQSAESKEDGQLFLCRSVIVDYIHLKDSGE